jgi:hypothetical protein
MDIIVCSFSFNRCIVCSFSFALCIVYCLFFFICSLYLFFCIWPLYCLFFLVLRLLITFLGSNIKTLNITKHPYLTPIKKHTALICLPSWFNPATFMEFSLSNRESEQSCICVLKVSIFLFLRFFYCILETVSTVLHFLLIILFPVQK